jgi:hypothetical protein
VEARHPRGKTSVNVPDIAFEKAADIFHKANVTCLTPNSGFAAARIYTTDIHGGDNIVKRRMAAKGISQRLIVKYGSIKIILDKEVADFRADHIHIHTCRVSEVRIKVRSLRRFLSAACK